MTKLDSSQVATVSERKGCLVLTRASLLAILSTIGCLWFVSGTSCQGHRKSAQHPKTQPRSQQISPH